jgi:methylase of polypeptide subunit release factors
VKVNRRIRSGPDPVATLRAGIEALRTAGYGPELLRERLSVRFPDDVGLLNRAPALERLRDGRTAADVALRLCFLEAEESASAVHRLFGVAGTRDLVAARVLRRRGARLQARLRVDVHERLALIADRRFTATDLGAFALPRGDMVYPPGSDSVLLAEAVPVRSDERVLDLCTGSGIQALQVAARATGVVAVDIGARAAAMARTNALLNDARCVEVRCGDLYAPVRGERFDLIIANPPFVPARTRGPAYHSGGPRGDRVLRRVVEGWEAHLRPGGRAVAISHLAVRRGETVADILRPWVGDFGGRVLGLVLETGTPVDLAAAQSLFALDDGYDAYAREVRDWTAYLRRHRVAQVVLLLLAAERSGSAALEVTEAFQRTLPLPLSKSPPTLVAEWLARG